MKKSQSRIPNILNNRAIIDDAKCLQSVHELRWSDGMCRPHCESGTVAKHGGMKPSRSVSSISAETVTATGTSMT